MSGNNNQLKKKYIHRKREQVASYNKKKDELKTGEALMHVDYSENQNNTQQYEIQSTYFVQQNFSIFTSCSYYHQAKQGDLVKISIKVIGEFRDHSRRAAFACTKANELKKGMIVH